MFKENALSRAAAWTPTSESLPLAARIGSTSANDEGDLPPLPPAPGQMVGTFGGRQRRYLVERQKQIRIYDPISQTFVTFSHDRYANAWLVVRFNSDVRQLDVHPAELTYKLKGVTVCATPHLCWMLASTGRKVFFWLRDEWDEQARRRYQMFSKTHNADVVLATWEELESLEVLVNNLQSGRQIMTMLQFAGCDIRQISRRILRHLAAHKGRASRGELGAELCSEGCLDCFQQVDAALFHLHALGRLRLDLRADDLGDDTQVIGVWPRLLP